MAIWKVLILGISAIIGIASCQNENRRGFVFSLRRYYDTGDRIITVEGGPSMLNHSQIKPTKTLKFTTRYIEPISLAVDAWNRSLYLFARGFKSIYRLNNFNIHVSNVTFDLIRDGISGSEVQIAFDWISRNIYWTDGYNNWIAVQPVFTKDTMMYRNIIETSLITPLALAIDPEAGFLFFSDLQPVPRIESCNLLGEHRGTLAISDASYPSHIAVDHDRKRIYWVDEKTGIIESMLYNGLEKTKYNTGTSGFDVSALLYFKDHLCASFRDMYMVGCINVTNISDTNTTNSVYGMFYDEPIAAAVYDPESQTTKVTNKCSQTKCQHFCINTPSIARCVCKEGYELNKDNITCKAGHILTKKGILFTNGSNICVLNILAINSNSTKPQCVVSKLQHVHYLQADSNRGIVYLWNKMTKSIQKYDLVTKRLYNVTFTNTAKGLFYDWINEGLYWSDKGNSEYRIRMFDLITKTASKYQHKDSSIFEYLTGNPYENVLFWVLSDGMYTYKIEMGSMNGTNRTTIVDTDHLTNPTALAYDAVYNRLYWIDSNEISSVALTPNMEQTKIKYHDSTGSYANTLYLYKDYALWIDYNNIKATVVMKNEKYVYQSTVTTVLNGSHVTSMTYFDQRTQTKTRAPCEGDNGGCQYLCIPTSTGPRCICPFGYRMKDNNKTCGNVPLTNNFALVADYNNRMYQIPLNKNVTAADIVSINITRYEYSYMHSLIYDASSKFVYWVTSNDEIYRSKLNGENYTMIKRLGKGYIDKLAVDETTGDLYYLAHSYTDYYSVSGYIAVLRLTTTKQWKETTVLEGNKASFLIHPQKGYIFWLDSYQQYLGRSNMDGTGSISIKKFDNYVYITDIYIDYAEDRIYWVNSGYKATISSMDLNGDDEQKFIQIPGTSEIAFQDKYMFVSVYSGRKIYKYDKTTKREVAWMKNITYIQGIDVMVLVPGNKQPENALCKKQNGYCSTFCLPTSTGRTCACENKVKLRDTKNCENVCDSNLPNGHITDCNINADTVCSYKCDSMHDENPAIKKIQCFRNMTWSHKLKDLCIEKRCTTNIPNVEFLDHCEGKIGVPCIIRCKQGYIQTDYKLPTISCSARSSMPKWNTDITRLCTKAVYCPVTVPNGRLFNCVNPTAGKSCRVYCRPGYSPFISSGYITCESNGQWNERSDKICQAQAKCSSWSKDVQLSNDCSGTIYSNCSYKCINGQVPAFPSVEKVTCIQGSMWIPPLNILCKGAVVAATDASNSKEPQSSNSASVIGGVMGIIILILIICLVLVVVFFLRRNRSMPEYKGEPNVFFRSPPVEENPYNQFSNIDGGHLAVTQFENPMSNVDPLYDNINVRQGAEGSSSIQQGLKSVEEKTVDSSYNMTEDTDNKVNVEINKGSTMA